MSAPAGWHLQPDGQERYWDGTQWTDHVRSPLPSDPTAPPPPPSWAPSVDETQALDVSHTQAIPAPDQPAWTGDPAQQVPQEAGYPQPGYPQPGYPQPGYQPPGYPQSGYGAPGTQPYAPAPRQGSGLAKGCLIAAIIGVVLLGIVGVAGFYFVTRAADTISENFPSGFPTDLPTGFPSDGSTDGLGQPVDVSVGDGFALPRATIEPGWTLEAQGDGVAVVDINGMKAALTSDEGFPVLFTMSFPDASGSQVETVCTASGAAGATVDVSCVPLFGDVADATRARVTSSF